MRARRLETAAALVAATCALLTGGCRDSADKADRGGPAARIVSLTPSSTELVAAVGATDRLVGRDRYSTYPPEVESLPVVGDFLSPNAEAIVRLRPDLVVLDQVQARIAPSLEQSGITTLVLSMHTLRDVRAGLVAVGEATGREREAAAAADRLDGEVAALAARTAARSERPRVLAIVDREPGALRGLVAAGPGSYLDELLARVGAENALAAAGVRYPKISADQILRDPPDVILDASQADPADWSALADLPAVKAERVHALRDRLFQSPSPRVDGALRELEELLYGSAAAASAP